MVADIEKAAPQAYLIQRIEGAKNPRKNLLPPPDSGSTVRASF